MIMKWLFFLKAENVKIVEGATSLACFVKKKKYMKENET